MTFVIRWSSRTRSSAERSVMSPGHERDAADLLARGDLVDPPRVRPEVERDDRRALAGELADRSTRRRSRARP
jgi:hypothetical protein